MDKRYLLHMYVCNTYLKTGLNFLIDAIKFLIRIFKVFQSFNFTPYMVVGLHKDYNNEH